MSFNDESDPVKNKPKDTNPIFDSVKNKDQNKDQKKKQQNTKKNRDLEENNNFDENDMNKAEEIMNILTNAGFGGVGPARSAGIEARSSPKALQTF